MKTKNLMTAFALSAMFAACTQDAELNETLAKNDYSNIPMVEADFTVDTGVDSRMANKFDWEKGDIVGFVWGGPNPTLDGKAYANNPLYCLEDNQSKFDGQSMYYIGEYFAYIPYSELKSLGNIPFSIKGQELSTTLGDYAKHKIMISPSLTELVELAEGQTLAKGQQEAGRKKNYPLNLSELSNFAKINLKFENAEALTDLKVTKVTLNLKNTSGDPIMPLNFKFTSEGYESISKEFKNWNTEVTPAEFFGTHFAEDFTASNMGALELTSKDGLAVSNNALTTYAVVLPTDGASLASLDVTVETNYGKIVAGDVKVIAQGKTEADAKAVSATTELFTEFGVNGTIVAKLDVEDIEVGEQKAATQAELNTILNKLVASEYSEAVTIKLQPATAATTKPFTLTDFYLPEGLKTPCIILQAGDKTNGKIEFAGNTLIDKKVALASPATVTGTMTVDYNKDVDYTLIAHASLDNTLTVDHGAVLYNNGKMYINVETVAAVTTPVAKTFGKYVSNGEHAKIDVGSITNNGEAQWIDGTVPTITGNNIYAYATSMSEIKTASGKLVKTIRLKDVTINNNQESWMTGLSSIGIIECYGIVNFILSSTPETNTPCTINFEYGQIAVMEGATLNITSNNKSNGIYLGSNFMEVKKNACLNAYNNLTNASVCNDGAVTLVNCPGIQKNIGYESAEGSSWNTTTNN